MPTHREDHVAFEFGDGPLVLVVGAHRAGYGGAWAKGHTLADALAAFKRFDGDPSQGYLAVTWTEDPGGVHVGMWGNVSWDNDVDATHVNVPPTKRRAKAKPAAKR